MTDEPIFFDTDCLSSFLWVGSENIIVNLFKSNIVLPRQVYNEITFVPPLKIKTDRLISTGEIILQGLETGSPELTLFDKLTMDPDFGFKKIGKGEASAIVLAKFNNGILGSNNLKDTRQYIDLFNLKYITTGGILVKALNAGLISETQGNAIWKNMISRKRKLPTTTFTDYLQFKNDDQTL